MKRSCLFGTSIYRNALLLLLCVLPLLKAPAAAEEPDDGRVRLYIKAADPNGGKLRFKWVQLEGPTVKVADPAAASYDFDSKKWISETYFIPTEPGTYVFDVSIKNDDGIESKRTFRREVLPASPPPVAMAGKDQLKSIGEVVVINGIGSHASPGRDIAEWEWRVISSPDRFKLDPKLLKERQFDFKALEPGIYQFELRIFDGKRWSEPSKARITVKQPPRPPEIEAVEPEKAPVELPAKPEIKEKKTLQAVAAQGRAVKAGETVLLDGSASIVDESDRPEFYWRQERRGVEPLVRTLTPDKTKPWDPARKDPFCYPVWKATLPAPGEYSFVLEISTKSRETHVESDPITFTVQAENHPPLARISSERTTVEVGDIVRLDGTKSSDPDNDPLNYVWGGLPGKLTPRNWRGVDGPLVEFRPEEDGEYGVSLTVSDGKSTSQDSVTITVVPTNKPPTVKLRKEHEGSVHERMLIEALVSDPENDPFEVHWTCIEPATVSIPDRLTRNKVLAFMPQNPGTYVFRITATDSKGHSAQADTTVVVKSGHPEIPPTAVIDGPKTAGMGEKVKLSGARSADPVNKPLTYIWRQEQVEGGAQIPGKQPGEHDAEWIFTVSEPGRYQVSLVVSNGVTKSEPERFEFTVPRSNRIPIASIAAPAATEFAVGEKLSLDGSASNDSDGDKITWHWRKLEGKGDIEITDPSQDHVMLTGVTPGPVKIELVVNDGKADSEPARLELTVTRVNHPPLANISGPAETNLNIGQQATLDGSGSSDPDKDKLTFKWRKAEGTGEVKLEPGRGGRASVTAVAEGTVKIELVVNDGAQDSDPAFFELAVRHVNHAPVAQIAVPATTTVVAGDRLVFDGSSSTDPDGDKISFQWRKVSGRGEVELIGANQDRVTISGVAPGPVKLELVVNDGLLNSPPAVLNVTVAKANRAPVASIAGPGTRTLTVGQQLTLDGSASSDPDGDRLLYKWSKTGGGADVKITDAGKGRATVLGLSEGEASIGLVVNDGLLDSELAAFSLTITHANHAPVARIATPAATQFKLGEKLVLDGTPSSDPDGGKLTYKWRKISGKGEVELSGADQENLSVTGTAPGLVKVELTVNDGELDSPPAAIELNVLNINHPPVAKITGPAELTLTVGQAMLLDGSASSDPDRDRMSFHWSTIEAAGAGEAKIAEGGAPKALVTALKEGTVTVELVVNDGTDNSESATVKLNILKADRAPVASIAPPASAQLATGETLTLDGSPSSDPDGDKLTYKWRKAGGRGGIEIKDDGEHATITGAVPGAVRVELVVNDGVVDSQPANIELNVIKVNPPPVALIAAPAELALSVGQRITLDSSGSSAASGGRLIHKWRKVGGDGDVALGEPNRGRISVDGVTPGAVTLELVVNDGAMDSAPAQLSFVVAKGNNRPVAKIAPPEKTKLEVGESIVLDGSASSDPDGDKLTYRWRKIVTGVIWKSDAELFGIDQDKLSVKALAYGAIKFELIVNDGQTDSAPEIVALEILKPKKHVEPPKQEEVVEIKADERKPETPAAPAAPVVEVREQPVVVEPPTAQIEVPATTQFAIGEKLTLEGSGASLSNAKLTYAWRRADGPGDVQIVPGRRGRAVLTALAEGAVKIELIVNDWNADSQPAVLELTVLKKNQPPVARIADLPSKKLEVGESIVLDGSASSDPDGDKLTYKWRKIVTGVIWKSDAELSGIDQDKLSVKALAYGAIKFELIVNDGQADSVPETVQLEILKPKKHLEPPKQEEVLQVKAEEKKPEAPAAPEREREEPKPVVKKPTAHPVARITALESLQVTAGDSMTLDASTSSSELDAGENLPLSYRWRKSGGKAGVELEAADQQKVTIKTLSAGSLKMELIVNNGYFDSAPVTVALSVQKAPEIKPLPQPEPEAPNTPVVMPVLPAGPVVEVREQPVAIEPPTAQIEPPAATQFAVGEKLTLEGSGAASRADAKLTYTWRKAEGAGDVQIIPGRRGRAVLTALAEGPVKIELIVNDGNADSQPVLLELTVLKKNQPPVARIADPPSKKIAVGESIVLDGSASSDPNGDKLTYKWRKIVTGIIWKSDAELSGIDQDKLSVKALAYGAIKFELIVNDGQSDSTPATVQLEILKPRKNVEPPKQEEIVVKDEEKKPEAPATPEGDHVASAEKLAPAAPEVVNDAKSDNAPAIELKPAKPEVKEGGPEARVTGSDVPPSAPVATTHTKPRAVASRVGNEIVVAGKEVQLSAQGSQGSAGAALTYKWRQISGASVDLPNESRETITVTTPSGGKFEFELVVSDGESESAPARVAFSAQTPNQKPVAVIKEVAPCAPGGKITLDGSSSSDPDGDKLEYRWSKVSGPDASFGWRGDRKAKIDITLAKEGEYVFELKVFDGKEWSEPAQVSVKTLPVNVPPVVVVANPNIRTEENVETWLDATGSSDPDNGPQPLTFIWRPLEGRGEIKTDVPRASFTPKKPGIVSYEVRAFDGKDYSAPATIKATVFKAGTLPVAVPVANPNPAKIAHKGVRNDPNILILDGTGSRSEGKPLTYIWKQVAGDDLGLKPSDLAKDRVGLRVFRPGKYRFVLTVSNGENSSVPEPVDVEVQDDAQFVEPGDLKGTAQRKLPEPGQPDAPEKK